MVIYNHLFHLKFIKIYLFLTSLLLLLFVRNPRVRGFSQKINSYTRRFWIEKNLKC